MTPRLFKAEVVLLRHLQMPGAFSIGIDLKLNYHIAKEDLKQCMYNLTIAVPRSIQAQASLITPLETKGIFLKEITVEGYDAAKGDWKPAFQWEAPASKPPALKDPNLIWYLYLKHTAKASIHHAQN